MKQQRTHKILILSGELGDGHKQAAMAILEASAWYQPNAEVEIVDFMKWTHPHLHSFGKFFYKQWVHRFPGLYGYLFQKTRPDNSFSQLFKKIKMFDLQRMLSLLDEIKPTVVVSTFPSAAAAMSVLKCQGLTQVPTVTVITDHTDHSYWIHPGTDQYIVGSDEVRQALKKYHLSDQQIAVTGIPVKPKFTQPFDRPMLRKKLGVEADRPTVLVMGGGFGIISKELTSLLWSTDYPVPVHFMVVCGRNDKLRRQLMERLQREPSRNTLTVYGYCDHVDELMAVSDLIVTKPGGLTTSEAITMGLPMLLHNTLPGQEQDNANYLVRNGLAVLNSEEDHIESLLSHLLRHPVLLERMALKAKSLRMKNSAYYALHAILRTESKWQDASICHLPALKHG
ncbi:MGDG synthase family glycosyltransferase [Paenibacillus senegalensis]|uniref:MGDG synthase family glycosyltransferase n=1 Tax=Paenibacillus senegalensis TaxID=1465766 RepID=UPI0002882A36|nr:glycosyltransferase [Paenibacillus senegalensis]